MMLMNGITVMTASDLDYPIWAIKRRDTDVEQPVNETGYPGYDHAIWYWWRLSVKGNRYDRLTFDAVTDRIEFHNQSYFRDAREGFGSTYWDRLNENTWRILYRQYGNVICLATLDRLEKIENPESTYRWYRG